MSTHWDLVILIYGPESVRIVTVRSARQGHESMKIRIILLALMLLASPLYANDLPQTFSKLKELDVAYSRAGDVSILYNEAITEVINKEFTEEESGLQITRAIRTKIDDQENTSYIVDYDEGFSVDPGFAIYREDGQKLTLIESFGGLQLIIPGNGNIYVSGHTNSMFNVRRKYKLMGSSFTEVKQPYYYVGLDSVTNADITLYESIDMAKEVAKLSKGTKITVLLNKGKYYLIKTPFGLTGWYFMKHEYPIGVHDKSELDGIYFNGD